MIDREKFTIRILPSPKENLRVDKLGEQVPPDRPKVLIHPRHVSQRRGIWERIFGR